MFLQPCSISRITPLLPFRESFCLIMPFPFRIGQQLRLHDSVIDFDDPATASSNKDISVSSYRPAFTDSNVCKDRHNSSSSVFVFIGNAGFMDSDRFNKGLRCDHNENGYASRRLRPAHSSVTLSAASLSSDCAAAAPQPLSSPLPQGHWSHIPEAYRPQSFVAATASEQPESLFAFRDRLPPPTIHTSHTPPSLPTLASPQGHSKRRRGVPKDIVVREPTAQDQPNPTFLYPQLSPYDDPVRTQRAYEASAPVLSMQRSVSQPQSPTWFNSPQSATATEGLPSLGIPRAPTYPPATPSSASSRRRMYTSDTATLQDDQELAMFAAASVGLGPEGTFRPAHASIDTSGRPFYAGSRATARYSPQRSDTISSTVETPTTRMALEQLASMPSSSVPSNHRPLARPSATGLDAWMSNPTPSVNLEGTGPTAMQPDVSPIDEELPDYATSQAQAVAKSRQAAANRAQELQRRWRAGMGSSHDRI
ncbi:hypothetical protein K431DRAFT_111490 [Polychaeton citri CBS 116435]|uniref:Uncharacterized protein n=1 Tax=Polychaeton citri CBS 116435 TaxID=1314669 RepID=A0A9P4Q4J0_9PEZI|nr:hypothetical protein K431DRAFT_111490 [Polychaeton citri CBS 116435]